MAELIDIEIGHPYLVPNFSFSRYANEQKRFFAKAHRRKQHAEQEENTVSFSLLIDDLDVDLTPRERSRLLNEFEIGLKGAGFPSVRLEFESSLEKYADSLIDSLKENNVYEYGQRKFLGITTIDPFLWAADTIIKTRSIKDVFFDKLDGDQGEPTSHSQSQFLIPLKEPAATYRKYGCSLLTAVWYLNRLNISGFFDPDQGRPKVGRLENILPQKYLKSEGFALEILSISRPRRVRDAARKIEYLIIR